MKIGDLVKVKESIAFAGEYGTVTSLNKKTVHLKYKNGHTAIYTLELNTFVIKDIETSKENT